VRHTPAEEPTVRRLGRSLVLAVAVNIAPHGPDIQLCACLPLLSAIDTDIATATEQPSDAAEEAAATFAVTLSWKSGVL
jgi:hypothetical protein